MRCFLYKMNALYKMAPIRLRRNGGKQSSVAPTLAALCGSIRSCRSSREHLLDCVLLGSAHAARSALLKWTFLSTDRQLSLYLHRRRTDPASTRFYFNLSLHSRNAADLTALQRIPKVMPGQHCTASVQYVVGHQVLPKTCALMLAPTTATSSSFGAFQFEERADYDHDGVGLQKVPGTPTQVEMRASMPPAEDYRMSCASMSCAVMASKCWRCMQQPSFHRYLR